jgi:hypothetical protein
VLLPVPWAVQLEELQEHLDLEQRECFLKVSSFDLTKGILMIIGTAKPVKHVTDNLGRTTTDTTKNLQNTINATTNGLTDTVTDSTTAVGNADILGLGRGLTGGVGKTVSGAGAGLVSVESLAVHSIDK